MAYLTEQERDVLLNELRNMTFRQAQGKLRRMDEKARMAYYRNAQQTGRWLTRYVLPGLGTRVTLVETHTKMATNKEKRLKSEYEFVEVIVEPTPDNRN